MDNSGSLICREEPKRVEEGQPVVEAGSQPVVEAGQLFSFEASSAAAAAAAATGGAAYLGIERIALPAFLFRSRCTAGLVAARLRPSGSPKRRGRPWQPASSQPHRTSV